MTEKVVIPPAEEIDIVITRRHALVGDWEALYAEVRAFKDACGGAHLKALARISRFFRDPAFREKLLASIEERHRRVRLRSEQIVSHHAAHHPRSENAYLLCINLLYASRPAAAMSAAAAGDPLPFLAAAPEHGVL